jgi:hypothetical protein
MGDTVWWSCPECGSYAELSAEESIGFAIACPDCQDPMVPQWRWEDTHSAA